MDKVMNQLTLNLVSSIAGYKWDKICYWTYLVSTHNLAGEDTLSGHTGLKTIHLQMLLPGYRPQHRQGRNLWAGLTRKGSYTGWHLNQDFITQNGWTVDLGELLKSQLFNSIILRLRKLSFWKGLLGSGLTQQWQHHHQRPWTLAEQYCAIQNRSHFTSLGTAVKQAWPSIFTPKSLTKHHETKC